MQSDISFQKLTGRCLWGLLDLTKMTRCGNTSEVAQSCPTLCNPMDCSLPGSSFHGIFKARVLEWVAISFSRASSRPRDWTQVSCRHFYPLSHHGSPWKHRHLANLARLLRRRNGLGREVSMFCGFSFFFATWHSIWDLSSPSRDCT